MLYIVLQDISSFHDVYLSVFRTLLPIFAQCFAPISSFCHINVIEKEKTKKK